MRLDNSHHESENARMDRNLHRRRSSAVANIEGELFDEQRKTIELQGTVNELRRQLKRAEALAKSALLESGGLASTLGQVHKRWKRGDELMSLDEVKSLLKDNFDKAHADPETVEKVEQQIASAVRPKRQATLAPVASILAPDPASPSGAAIHSKPESQRRPSVVMAVVRTLFWATLAIIAASVVLVIFLSHLPNGCL